MYLQCILGEPNTMQPGKGYICISETQKQLTTYRYIHTFICNMEHTSGCRFQCL